MLTIHLSTLKSEDFESTLAALKAEAEKPNSMIVVNPEDSNNFGVIFDLLGMMSDEFNKEKTEHFGKIKITNFVWKFAAPTHSGNYRYNAVVEHLKNNEVVKIYK